MSEREFEGQVAPGHPSVVDSAYVRVLVEHVAHLLPAQGPIDVFVHHNTLHAFEERCFHDAVQAGLARYGAQPYLTEQEYRCLYSAGRITDVDLEAALQDDLGPGRSGETIGLSTRTEIRYAMLRHPLQVGSDAELRWIVAETDALERFRDQTTEIDRARIVSAARQWLKEHRARCDPESRFEGLLTRYPRREAEWTEAVWESFSLHLLWRICLHGIKSSAAQTDTASFVRPRDWLLQATGRDIDRHVHETLIRFCAAFVDQGFSDWPLPNRDLGFFESFVALYSEGFPGSDRWLRRMPQELNDLQNRGRTAEESIAESLEELGITASDHLEFVTQSLLALAGWAGMIWQLESGSVSAVHRIPKGSLVGLLAVQLILKKHAIRHVGEDAYGESSVTAVLQIAKAKVAIPRLLNIERRAFLLFQVVQMLGWTPLELLGFSGTQWLELTREIESFSGLERRRVFHEAYERKFRNAALDALAIHTARSAAARTPGLRRPGFQILTCIDDREESFRRHLEEVQPQCQTFGAAGFFAVAMYYRGAAEGFYKALCPGVITPRHYVQEDVGYTFEGLHRNREELRRRLGWATYAIQRGSRSFAGGLLAGIAGSLATAPLVARVLFPHLTARLRKRAGSLVQPPTVTRLQLERYADPPGPSNGHIGFTTDEMAEVVIRLLQDIGLTKAESFATLFIICGHGSSSLNNPHESAYCCGACAGKRGGPNARSFAQMANDWRVRAKVAGKGIPIPDDTVFVGAYHDTCDDSVIFLDLDRLPASHRAAFEATRQAIEEARRRNAHERCRRFDSAPLTLSPEEALRHVQGRAQDISQVRPEYNHATNALCVVGRRAWTRGLFLDRRSFLISYDPAEDDPEHGILQRILAAAIPVCAGIGLEYYFSRVDVARYGAGSKLPHNIVSLLGVMEGTSSDLRTGLHQQMVEVHEPMRLTFIIETDPQAMLSIMGRNPAIERLVTGGWVHLAVIDPQTSTVQVFRDGAFRRHVVGTADLPEAASSRECYQGSRDHRPFCSVREAASCL